MKKAKIGTDEFIKLKEKGMTDKDIAAYYTKQGIEIKENTVSQRLYRYYKTRGQKRPNVSNNEIDISKEEIEEMVELRNKGISYRNISFCFAEKNRLISETTIKTKVEEYINSMQKQGSFRKIEITKNELKEMVYLKENGMSDTDIAKYFTKKGKAISSTTVGKRLLEYYDKKGKIKPRGVKKEHKKRIILTEEELKEMSELKADGLSYKSIAEYFKANYNKNLTTSIVRTRLLEYHNTHEKSKPRRKRKYEDDIKEILMTGISIEEFISGFEKVDEKELIEKKINKLRVIAECSKKENGEFIPDNNFLKVLDIIDDSSEKIKWYEGNTDRYITDGKCRKGNIDLIREKVFNRNTDLMVYVLSRMNVIYQPGYDMRVYNIMKSEYEEKIDKYIERLNSIENNRKNNKLNSEKSNNIKLQGEER